MQVQRIAVPVEARGASFGGDGFWLARSREVASATHRPDPGTGFARSGQASVWAAVPVSRDVLLAAWMIDGIGGVGAEDLARMDADEIRDWALGTLLREGTDAAQRELDTAHFVAAYRTMGRDLAAYFALLTRRISEAFGFDSGAAGARVRVPASRPAPTCELATV